MAVVRKKSTWGELGMLGLQVTRNVVVGTTLRFDPGTSRFLTNGKGLGISITLQSPIAFHISLPFGKRRYKG